MILSPLPLRLVVEDGAGGASVENRHRLLSLTETSTIPYNPTTANEDILLQFSGQFYLGVFLKYFVNLVLNFHMPPRINVPPSFFQVVILKHPG